MKKKLVVLVFIFMFVMVGCSSSEGESMKSGKITCNQMKEIMSENSNAILVDVRYDNEYKEGHLDNAINIDYNYINRVGNIEGVDLNTPIIVYCKSGKRSEAAYNTLVSLGYNHVYDLGAISNCK